MLNISETQRRDAEAKLANAEAKLEESKFAIASLQASKAALQNTLNQSIQETHYCKQARLAFVWHQTPILGRHAYDWWSCLKCGPINKSLL
jgi:hypothetical protein